MASWRDIQNQIEAGRSEQAPMGDFDGVRKEKYAAVKAITGRTILVYATAFHVSLKQQLGGFLMPIDFSDKDGFQEILRNIPDGLPVDIFIHSPGGSAEATESIVKMLRAKFTDIRFIVTGTAKSAATMMVLSGNRMIISQAGELGPIDPQVGLNGRYSPAGSIIEQFEKAAKDLQQNPSNLPVWIPILEKYAPSLLIECQNFLKLSKVLVKGWLAEYMFAGEQRAKSKAARIASYLSNEKKSLSHARRIGYEQLKELGIKVELLEEQDSNLVEALLEMHYAIMATLEHTSVVKMFENSEGAALMRVVNTRPS